MSAPTTTPGIRERLLASAAEWDAASRRWRDIKSYETADVCNTAAMEFRDLASQCREAAALAGLVEYMDQAAEANERTAKQWAGTGSVERFLTRNAEAWSRAASMARQCLEAEARADGHRIKIEAVGLRKSDAVAYALRLIGMMMQEAHTKGHSCGGLTGNASGRWEPNEDGREQTQPTD